MVEHTINNRDVAGSIPASHMVNTSAKTIKSLEVVVRIHTNLKVERLKMQRSKIRELKDQVSNLKDTLKP